MATAPVLLFGARRRGAVVTDPAGNATVVAFGPPGTFLRSDGTFATPPNPGGDGISQTSFLVSGGQVVWQTAYQFRVSAASSYIQGVAYTSPETVVTLGAAHATLDRVDIIALNSSGDVVVVAGTAAAQPSEPDLDPATQLRLGPIPVDAATTAPATISNVTVYLENAGSPGEWNWSASAGSIVVNSTSNPRTGTTDIEGTSTPAGVYAQGTIGAGMIDPANYSTVVAYLRPKATWGNGRGITVTLRNAGVLVGAGVNINRSGTFGFASSTLAYQQVAIPVSQFAASPGAVFDQVRLAVFGGAIGFYVDDIVLQAGVAAPVSGMTQAQADARYRQLAVPLVLSAAADVSGDLPLANLAPAAAASRLLGRRSGSAGDWEPVTLGASFSMSAGAELNVTAGAGLGDVVGPASAVDDRIATFDGTTGKLIQDGGATIAGVLATALAAAAADIIPIALASEVSGDLPLANLAQASAASKLLGRGDSGAGDYQEITVGSGLAMTGTTLSASGGGLGDVVGPSASVASEIVLFDGTTGKLIKRATGTGPVKVASGVASVGAINLASAEVTGLLALANLATRTTQIGWTFVSPTTGAKTAFRVPVACTVTAARLVASASCSIVVDLWKDSYANFPPTVADTITASAKPTLSAAVKGEDTTLTGWTVALAAGDWLIPNVDSVASAPAWVVLALTVTY